MVTPAEIKAKFPLIEESMIQGGLWDPDAGLVVPRSQTVAGLLVENAEKTGRLRAFANTPALELIIEDGHIRGVVTPRGTIRADIVIVFTGIWGARRRRWRGRHPADPRPRNRRAAGRQPGPAVLHHLDRLWPQHGAQHHDGLSAA
ncbi:FAD-dependent oxidoreductase [Paracoccus yeei]|uniref:FAD-dependent oxidoreductase n=1 Tax=Paracoccus yeei TaxID=147645 RepID=UPI00048FC43B|nr:FAD-dependent oxidoreductase [Paracoccus yeei]